jgi:hypothetical protein
VPALIDGEALRPNVGQPRLTARRCDGRRAVATVIGAAPHAARGWIDQAPTARTSLFDLMMVRPLVWAARVI